MFLAGLVKSTAKCYLQDMACLFVADYQHTMATELSKRIPKQILDHSGVNSTAQP